MALLLESTFEGHKEKARNAYFNWKNSQKVSRAEFHYAGMCVEHIIRALTVDVYNIKDFSRNSYYEIQTKNLNYKIRPLNQNDNFFGVGVCIYLLKLKGILEAEFYEPLKEIKDNRNYEVHLLVNFFEADLKFTNNWLDNFVSWFTKRMVGEMDWTKGNLLAVEDEKNNIQEDSVLEISRDINELEYFSINNGIAYRFCDPKIPNHSSHFGLVDKNKIELLPQVYREITKVEILESSLNKNLVILKMPNKDEYTLFNCELYDIDKREIIFKNFSTDSYMPKFYHDRLVIQKNGKYGFINLEGKICIPLIYEQAYSFYFYNMALVQLNGKFGLIDIYGRFKIANIYDCINKESCYDGFVVEINGKWKFIDQNGNDNSPAMFDDIRPFADYKLCWIKLGDKWGILNKNGSVLIEPKYKSSTYGAPHFNKEYHTIVVGIENLWGIIDWDEKIILPIEYEEVKDLSEVFFSFKKLNRWIITNSKGLIINSYFDAVNEYNDDRCLVKRSDCYGYLDKNGTEIVPIIYQHGLSFSYEKAAVKLNDKYGFIDIDGNIIISMIYEEAKSFDYKVLKGVRAKVKVKGTFFSKWKWIEIDEHGNEL